MTGDSVLQPGRISIVAGACPVCGNTAGEALGRGLRDVEERVEGSYDISRCPTCRLVYLSRRPAPGSLAACYGPDYYSRGDRSSNPLLRFLFNLRYRGRVRRLVRALGKVPRSVLELGCGDGGFLFFLERRLGDRCRLAGVDLDVSGINAPPGSRIRFGSGTVDGIPPGDRFDAVLMYNVLEHLGQPVATLATVRELLAPGAVIVVQVPNWDSLWRHVFPRHWGGLQIPRHQVFFDADTLADTLGRAGLRLRECRKVFDPGDLSVSLGNWLTEGLSLATKPRRAWFHHPLVLLSAPLVALQNALLRESGEIEATAVVRDDHTD